MVATPQADGAPIDRPIFAAWPRLERSVPWVALGDFPTPVEPLNEVAARVGGGELWVKRDDRSAAVYGGNKVRTLEALFGEAKAAGATRVYSTGAFGSNHATATVLHARRVDLEPGVILFPQPRSHAALENLRVILSARPVVHALPHWSFLPLGMAWASAQDRRAGVSSSIMVPGGATPEGALGYVSAALELAHQVARGEMPTPTTVLVGIGSTCTSAGLLVGLRAAAELGIGWTTPPKLVSVRVTPWPVTAAFRVVSLAHRTAALLAERVGDRRWAFDRLTLAAALETDGRYLGSGYGEPTDAGRDAIRLFREAGAFELDTTYSAKAVASALDRLRAGHRGPLLYWSTKSTAPLPSVERSDWAWAPPRMTRWIERAERDEGP